MQAIFRSISISKTLKSLNQRMKPNFIASENSTYEFIKFADLPHQSVSRSGFDCFHTWRTQYNVSGNVLGLAGKSRQFQRFFSINHLADLRKVVYDRLVRFHRAKFPGNYYRISKERGYRRRWKDFIPSADDTVMCLIVSNIAVFFLWKIADPTFMWKNFVLSVENFRSGRWHTLITSAFSHENAGHIFSNMFGLYFFGTDIARSFGPEYVLKLYLSAAIFGSIFFLIHQAYLIKVSLKERRTFYSDKSKVGGLGASDAVTAMVLLSVFLNPKAIFLHNFLIPVPAVLLGAIIIGQDIWRVMEGDTTISGASHLGGALVAALFWAKLKRKI